MDVFQIEKDNSNIKEINETNIVYKKQETSDYSPLVSVVIISYNNGIYLKKCINSVIAQTLKNIEIICVDDCSTDGSQDVLTQLKKDDPRVKVLFHKKNLSASKARKNGVLQSIGKYVMLVDGDDELSEKACEIAYNTIHNKKTDMVQFGTIINNIGNVTEERLNNNYKLVRPYIGLIDNKDLVKACWEEHKFGFQIWNKIYNGDIIRKSARYIEDGFYPKAQDLYFFFIIAYFSHSYFGISENLYRYNLGIGCTGSDILTLEKYRTTLKEEKIVGLLKKFLNKNKTSVHDNIVNNIYNGFINECFYKWLHYTKQEDKSKSFKYLCDTFSFRNIIQFLCTKYWYYRIEISKMLIGIDYFKYKKRNKKRKNIVAYYRCIKNGGAQRVVSMLCNKWSDMKDKDGEYIYNVILVTDNGPENDEYPLNKNVIREYVYDRSASIKERYMKRYDDWYKIIDKYDVDIVVNSLWLEPATYWDMLAIKAHPKHPAFFIHSHSTCLINFLSTQEIAYDIALRYKLCDGVIALSECDKSYIQSFNKNVCRIPNPFDFNILDIQQSEYIDNLIMWCGRISHEKGCLDVIKMMKVVVDNINNAKLIIVGDGSGVIKKNMHILSEKYKLEKNIDFIGFTNNVHQYYMQASVFVCTSDYEGFSLTIGEALAHRVPVVTYDMPYLSFIRDGRGIIPVPEKDYVTMALEVVKLLKDIKLIKKIGNAGYKHIYELIKTPIENKWKYLFDSVDAEDNIIKYTNTTYDILLEQLTKFTFIGRNNLRASKDREYKKS